MGGNDPQLREIRDRSNHAGALRGSTGAEGTELDERVQVLYLIRQDFGANPWI
jgi:hypothetical protein